MKAGTVNDPDLVAIVGHTAAGKTAVAAQVARRLDGEVISADSRQVYRGMDLGTGKDYDDYLVEGIRIPCHLVDVRDAGDQYTLFDYQGDFRKAYQDIRSRGKLPVLCGGSGLYLESVLKSFQLHEVPPDPAFRKACASKTDEELTAMLESYGPLHNITDTCDRDRLIRALEIAGHSGRPGQAADYLPELNYRVFGIRYEREERRNRITRRLEQRLANGMIHEVENLLEKIDAKSLMYYGLEYKYLTQYCLGQLTYEDMFSGLNTAIHQFAKRQMTWFRGMEKRGIPIHWIPGELPLEDKIQIITDEMASLSLGK